MNILIANQKGGVGKSTITTLLANYLVLEKKEQILVIDLDFQDTVYQRWTRNKEEYKNEPLYEVMKMDIDEYATYAKGIEEMKSDAHLIMDMPGRLDDDKILEIIKGADLIICPINYEQSIFESTFFFAEVVKAVAAKAKLVFLPTRVMSSIKYETEQSVIEALRPFGEVAPKIPERVALMRIDSFSISSEAMQLIKGPFDFIYQSITQQPV
ncbi:ParA family protein [Rufibacter sp. XAAS-G3-1]|uniref:ParA family protein n=1 Tax=Rufibacter sp. XAAS-G3-1 TaxID=2729134 RepID=UPI0015E76E6F|nr:ParA family protein [Rufibacter sp. XAAS-G3-1]